MEIFVKSAIDGSVEPCLFFEAEGKKRPLLVGLHTWSFDRFNQVENMLPYAKKHDFNLLLPEFRGANLISNPRCTESCGSELAVADVVDAIAHVVREYDVDADNIFLLGLSGGGHMTLMMCGTHPELFKAAGAYVPITDLEMWIQQNPNYRPHVLACCSDSAEEMKKRSPITYVDNLAKANLKIFHGKYDPVVPVSHSIDLYMKILEKSPSARVYLDIFDGAHEIDMQVAMYWLLSQYEGKGNIQITG